MRPILFCILAVFFSIHVFSQVKVKVFSPEDLSDIYKDNKEMSLTLANYGYVPYGKSLIGTLHLATPRNGCLPLEPFMTNNSHSDPSPIVVMERGGCHFVTKTHYAQLIGAKMALIIDNREENEDYVIMIDDGFGHDISIPTIMVSKRDGDNILKYLESNETELKYSVALSFHFDMPNPDDNVEYELWMSAMDTKSYEFLEAFKSFQDILGESAPFTPHYALWFCPMCKVTNFVNTVNENCVSYGRYCAPDPDGDGPLTGREVVMEDLRQICLYNLNNRTWWDYAIRFSKQCMNTTNLTECSEKIYPELGYDKSKLEQCIDKSFGNSKNTENDNDILAAERQLFLGEGIQIWPSIRINNITYRGNLVPSDGVFDAICEGLKHPLAQCRNSQEFEDNKNQKSEGGSGSIVGVVFLVIFALLIFMVIIMIFYKRWMRQEISKDIQLQVNTTISQYFALREERKV